MTRPEAARVLDEAHARLERDGSLELELHSANELLDADGQPESGADRLAGVLVSARRLPERVAVRVLVPHGAADEPGLEAAFHDHCRARAESAWRQAATIRRAGRNQLVPSIAVAAAASAVAAAAGAAAQTASSHWLAAVLYVVVGIGVISSWVIAWMPIEQLTFDWRPADRAARAYELLAHSRLEAVHSSVERAA